MAGILSVRTYWSIPLGTPAEAEDLLLRLNKFPLQPWRITIHTSNSPLNGTDIKLAEKFNGAASSLAFNYGAIEAEPSFPMTNFGGDEAYKAGQLSAPGGVVGNAHTHCMQLPNTFALAGARKDTAVRCRLRRLCRSTNPGPGTAGCRRMESPCGR